MRETSTCLVSNLEPLWVLAGASEDVVVSEAIVALGIEGHDGGVLPSRYDAEASVVPVSL
jgi:hypothetical protein